MRGKHHAVFMHASSQSQTPLGTPSVSGHNIACDYMRGKHHAAHMRGIHHAIGIGIDLECFVLENDSTPHQNQHAFTWFSSGRATSSTWTWCFSPHMESKVPVSKFEQWFLGKDMYKGKGPLVLSDGTRRTNSVYTNCSF